ncbi:MAG TPA: ice-binding family protein [Candidatus Acidoferrales bacterium]
MKPLLAIACMLTIGSVVWAQSAPPLASSQTFAVLGATTVTSTGLTVINGDLGVSPGTAVTGFPPGTVIRGAIHADDPTAVTAQADAHTAYADLVAEACGTNLSGKILGTSPGAVVLAPGVYCFGSSAQLTGTLTLSGNGVYVFQIGSTLTSASNASVVLAGGATAENVFWQVGSSATLGDSTFLEGSILAHTSVSVTSGSSVAGHIFALTAAVTLDTNAIDTASNQQFTIESDHTSLSAELATSSDPNATVQCTVAAPCLQDLYLAFNTISQQPAILGNPNVLWATNSIDDPDQLISLTTSNLCGSNSVIQVGNEDGTSYTFSGSSIVNGAGNSNPCLSSPGSPTTGSYSLSTGEIGNYTIYALPDPSGIYTGTFNDNGSSGNNHKNATGNGSDTLSLNVNSDFSVTATLVVAPGELCPAQTTTLTLSSSDPVAINNGVDPTDGISSVSVGESVELSLADNVGDLEWVIMSDQDANGNVLPVGTLYATGFSAAGVCDGTLIYDKPFAQKGVRAKPRPGNHHHRRYLTEQMREFEERVENGQRR